MVPLGDNDLAPEASTAPTIGFGEVDPAARAASARAARHHRPICFGEPLGSLPAVQGFSLPVRNRPRVLLESHVDDFFVGGGRARGLVRPARGFASRRGPLEEPNQGRSREEADEAKRRSLMRCAFRAPRGQDGRSGEGPRSARRGTIRVNPRRVSRNRRPWARRAIVVTVRPSLRPA